MCARQTPSSPSFDFSQARGPKAGPDVGQDSARQPAGPASSPASPLTVTALIARIKSALSAAFPQRLSVVGELSNVKLHSSGHIYFRIKDAGGAIDAAMFRSAAGRLKFRPTDGLEVVIDGRVDVYDVRGQLQFYAEAMVPKGAGALELAFRQMREKLQQEGLFASEHKRPIARYPRAVGIVTSPTGAAVRDVCRTLRRRWPAIAIYVMPVLVQGPGAAADIARGIALLDAHAEQLGIDTLIVARGGGSLEDLWAFNEEVVARAVFACQTPIISGVGHEVDVTICDLVADLRAPTPTGAAELAVPEADDAIRHVGQLAARLDRSIRDDLRHGRARLDSLLRSAVFRDPAGRLRVQAQRLDEWNHRLQGAVRRQALLAGRRLEPAASRLGALHPARLADRASAHLADLLSRLRWALGGLSKRGGDRLARLEMRLEGNNPKGRLVLARQQVAAALRQLEAMSYRSVLQRGFSVTRGGDGRILRSAAEAPAGSRLETELADGKIKSTVDGPRTRSPKTPDSPSLFENLQ